MLEDILVPLAFFLGSAFVLFKFFDGRHKENMAMIERGLKGADVRSSARRANPYASLKYGLLLLFSGIGLLAGQYIELTMAVHYSAFVPACVLIGGGLGLFLFYLVTRKKFEAMESAQAMRDMGL